MYQNYKLTYRVLSYRFYYGLRYPLAVYLYHDVCSCTLLYVDLGIAFMVMHCSKGGEVAAMKLTNFSSDHSRPRKCVRETERLYV